MGVPGLTSILATVGCLILSAPQEPAKLRSVENAFDVLSLVASVDDKLSAEQWDKTAKSLGLSGSQSGGNGNWSQSDDRGTLMVFSVPSGGYQGFSVTLSYHAPLTMATAILETVTRTAASTKPGPGSTLVLTMPKDGIRDRGCVKEAQYTVTLEGALASKGFSLLCPR